MTSTQAAGYDQPSDETPAVDERRPAASGSPLSSLRARRDTARQRLHLDLEVPRMDPPVYVRYSPLPHGRITAITKRFEKSKDADRDVLANAAILAEACQGIYEVIDGREVSVDDRDRDGDWPRFDDRLAELLGITAGKASDVVRGLYLTDGDVIATASRLAEWSGYSAAELEEREGN